MFILTFGVYFIFFLFSDSLISILIWGIYNINCLALYKPEKQREKMKRIYHSITSIFLYRIFVSVLCSFSSNLIAQTTSSDCNESPYFLISNVDTAKVHLPLVSTDVNASISGVIANVVVTQTYVNKSDTTIEASYVFPMSTRAAVYAMQMFVGGRKIEAVIKKKDEAKQIYDSAKTAGQTASLLIQNRPNVFKMSIANIFAGDTIQIQMTYTETLMPEKGIYEIVFPSIVGTRYSLKNEEWEIQSPSDSAQAIKSELKFNVKINAGMAVDAQCVSHNAAFSKLSDNNVECNYITNPGKDFIVNYTLANSNIETGLLLYPSDKENFFLAMIQPPRISPESFIPKREYVFILDISGSMSGTPLETLKSMILDLISKLNPQDLFNVLWFSDNSDFIFPEPMLATQENISNATTILNGLQTLGGTQMLPALNKGLAVQATSECAKTIVILTDGYVDIEKEAFQLVRDNLGNANFFAFGIGESVNRYFIEGVAYVGQGTPFVVTDTTDVQKMSDRFRDYISKPVLTDVKATFNGFAAYDVEPYTIPDVFAERPILLYGKYNGKAEGSITISGISNNTNYTKTINIADCKADTNNIALKYLWARNKIKLLDDYGITDSLNPKESIENKVTKLGLDYHLVTQYTSFVAVDTLHKKIDSTLQTNNGSNTSNVDLANGTIVYPGNSTSISSAGNYATISSEIVKASVKANTVMQLYNYKATDQTLFVKINSQKLNPADYTLVITDEKGSKHIIKNVSFNELSGLIEVDIKNLNTGVYSISLQSNKVILESLLFIKL